MTNSSRLLRKEIRSMKRVSIIDSHTGGEPTRVVIAGGPTLAGATVAQKREEFAKHHDRFRAATIDEPRGSDVLVGALLCESQADDCTAGVIFYNNVGVLGMCGHGLIGVVTTLHHLGRIAPGTHRFETPVGIVSATLHTDLKVSITNVPSYRQVSQVKLNVDGDTIVGDVAWGGNWFFLVKDWPQPIDLEHVETLTDYSKRIRAVLNASGFPEVDHIELFSAPHDPKNDSRNFVLCPGHAFDRSPCGTGTSAKLACLAADGKLAPGQIWRQESVIGSVFEGSYQWSDGQLYPTVKGQAWICGEADLLFDPTDPFHDGIYRHVQQRTLAGANEQ